MASIFVWKPKTEFYLYGVLIINMKIIQRKVLLETIEHYFYLQSILINCGYFIGFHCKKVADERIYFL
ncbi:hypothetical protein DZC72_14435 [Maribacter algicola]|uniref:Uncharacterized protein n=1 Tax=Maribacter algicola TaxID=2498892 RepID=A0A3R8Q3D8_9FLAO|nr:hypothetical protein DZC72_14435 [Maribacter algicola]